jgi:DNA-binding NtrC family response regulator
LEPAGSGREAVDLLRGNRYDLVLTDVRMDGMTGIELLRTVRSEWPELPVIVMTAFAGVDTAVSSIQDGAFDYVSKPYDIDELRATVRRAVEQVRSRPRTAVAEVEAAVVNDSVEIVGRSPAMAGVYKKIALVARGSATVLVEGETGSGKELVARAIHRNSERREAPFVAINCGALTESLLESELFGHVRGAFTGATFQKRGLFEMSNHGTILLDEIGETTPAMQTRLLRVLEEHEIQRVGSSEPIPVDIRVVAATNRALDEMVHAGAFREDLYYRLNVVRIEIPPLRQRLTDIPLLFDAFLRRHGSAGGAALAVDPAVLDMLAAHSWPGNVRELENAVERAVALNTTGVLTRADFSEELQGGHRRDAVFSELLVPLEDIERQYVEHVIARTDGNMTRAAEILGVDRRTLYRMLDRHEARANPDVAGSETPAGPEA